jgi:hypothetical protein
MRRGAGKLEGLVTLAAVLGLVIYVGLGFGLRPGPAIGQDLPAIGGTPTTESRPGSAPESSPAAESSPSASPASAVSSTSTEPSTPPATTPGAGQSLSIDTTSFDRSSPAAGSDTTGQTPAGETTPTPGPEPTPTPPFPSGPMEERLSADQAIDLIWKGDYDRAERALQFLNHETTSRQDRAEILVYLAFLASIRHEDDDARTLLRQALAESPGLALSPVEFPKALRDLLTEVRADVVREKPRPQRGALGNPRQVLAPAATPPGWKNARKPWYRRWYVWAGVGAAVAVAVVAAGSGSGHGPTATPTRSPTPRPTPTLFYYPGPGPNDLATSQTPGPCETGGETEHRFPFPLEPTPINGTVIVRSAKVVLEIQGDYDGLDEQQELARVRIETNPPRFALDTAGSFCTTSFPKEESSEIVRAQIQAALADGIIRVFVKDAKGVNDNCARGCSPFHRVSISFTYSVASP